ncbi:5537_t:CDS:1 [Paraglomus occultum]|uniref:Phosphatidylglycerol/phosphatidylinositol transfer protein n=1 Tax=Paraglomus occultum TaxID=144539 RepID=A0A9N9AMP5_9GLOM|nr:5537_t:CDS:1 [Paraglomus occultum]
MNRNALFLFFFLALISAINAMPHQFYKRTTEFKKCQPPGNDVEVTRLKIRVVPDPIVSNQNATFTISGTAKVDFPTGSNTKLSITYNKIGGIGPVIGEPYFVDFCGDGSPCPVKKGDKFHRTVSAKAPNLPTIYSATILINVPEVVYACAIATVGI